jgi:hypothetical protein
VESILALSVVPFSVVPGPPNPGGHCPEHTYPDECRSISKRKVLRKERSAHRDKGFTFAYRNCLSVAVSPFPRPDSQDSISFQAALGYKGSRSPDQDDERTLRKASR